MLAQLSKIRTFLTEAKLNIEHRDPHKRWEFMPIYEYAFRKLNDSQTQDGSSQLGVVGYITVENAGSHTNPRTYRRHDDPTSECDTDVEDNPSSPQSEGHRNKRTSSTKCSASHCITGNNYAQCQDPVHYEDMDIEYPSTRAATRDSSANSGNTVNRRSHTRTGNPCLPPPI